MASADLRRLWKLHLIDAAILEIRARAAQLDGGKKLKDEIETLTKQLDGHGARKLSAEQLDLELKQKSIDDKIAKFEKELYGGKVVNPREVENYGKEIAILKKQKGDIDERILAIWEELPPLAAQAEKYEKLLTSKKQELAEAQKKAVDLRAKLEADFKQKSAERPLAAKEVSQLLLAKYEAIRPNHSGLGMSEIIKKNQCDACGTLLPERTLQGLLDDKIITCQSCHRILYYSDGAV